MAEEHFRITADATGVQAAAAAVSRDLNSMIAAVRAVNTTGGPTGATGHKSWAKELRHDIAHAQRYLRRFAMDAMAQAAAVDTAWKKVALTLKSLPPSMAGAGAAGAAGSGGGRGGGGAATWRILRLLEREEERSINRVKAAAESAERADRAEKRALRQEARYRPLFGNRLALDQGQEMQNIFASMLPLIATGAMYGWGINQNIQENVSATRFQRNMERLGVVDGQGNAVANVLRYAGPGASRDQVRNLMEIQAMGGETDIGRMEANARLGLDLEAAGVASATEFLEALAKDGPQAADAVRKIAENAGLDVPDGATLNDMISMLNSEFKGFAGDIQEARGSWGNLWNALKENVVMASGWMVSSDSVDAATAALQGDLEKSNFLLNNNRGGLTGSLTEMSKEAFAELGYLTGNEDFADRMRGMTVEGVRQSAHQRVVEGYQAGSISLEDARRINEDIRKVAGVGPGGERDQNLSRLYEYYDRARPMPGLSGGDAAAHPEKGHATGVSPQVYAPTSRPNEVRVVVAGDAHNPTPMRPPV